MTEQQASNLVKRILGAFPVHRVRLSDVDVAGMTVSYTAGLIDLDFVVAREAVDRANKTSDSIPTIARIRREALGVAQGDQRSGLEAWGDVRALQTFRDRRDEDVVDPLVLEVCRRFGWIETRTKWRGTEDVEQWHVVPGNNESSDRARFAELYNKLAGDARKTAQVSVGGGTDRQLAARDGGAVSTSELMRRLGRGGNDAA